MDLPPSRILKGGFFMENHIVHAPIQKLAKWMMDLPAPERQGIETALDYLEGMPEEEKTKAVLALERAISPRIRARKSHETDVKLRTLVGARVNREFADLCKAAAKAKGQSLTRWCKSALWDALIRQDKVEPIYSAGVGSRTQDTVCKWMQENSFA